MKNLAFVGNGEPPKRLLEVFRKMTPGRSGVWKNLRGVDNYEEADYLAVIDWLPAPISHLESKCVFLGAHPETLNAYRNMKNYKGIKMFDCAKTFGFGEWWLSFDYDYLKALQPPVKTKLLGCVLSNSGNDLSHVLRKEWMRRFTDMINVPTTGPNGSEYLKNKIDFNLHGRIVPFTDKMKEYYRGVCGSYDPRGSAASGGNDHMSGKEQVYLEHKYVLEFDNIGTHYFSERVFDSLLCWAMPIYWGGEFLDKYLPENSFRFLNIEGSGEDVIKIVNSNFYEEHLDDISKARNLLLEKYHIWARVHEAIYGE